MCLTATASASPAKSHMRKSTPSNSCRLICTDTVRSVTAMGSERPSFSALIKLVLPTCSNSQRRGNKVRAFERTICGPTTITRQLRDSTTPPRSAALTNANTPCVPRAITSAGMPGSSPQLWLATHALQSQHSKDKEFKLRQPRMSDDETRKLNGPPRWCSCYDQSETHASKTRKPT